MYVKIYLYIEYVEISLLSINSVIRIKKTLNFSKK